MQIITRLYNKDPSCLISHHFYLHHELQLRSLPSGNSDVTSNIFLSKCPAWLFHHCISHHANVILQKNLYFPRYLLFCLFIGNPIDLLGYWLLLPTNMQALWHQGIDFIPRARNSGWNTVSSSSVNVSWICKWEFLINCQALLQVRNPQDTSHFEKGRKSESLWLKPYSKHLHILESHLMKLYIPLNHILPKIIFKYFRL
jgi:hypothetical protein